MALLKKELEVLIQTHNYDWNDHIKPQGVFELFQDLAALHADELGIGYENMMNNNMAWVILYETYEIIKMPKFLENVIVKTWPKPKGRIEFEREYLISDLNGNDLIKGISNWVVIDINNRSFVRAEKVDYDGQYYTYTNYNEKVKRKIGLDKESAKDSFSFKVLYDDLDHNKHMNNTRYLSHIYNNYDFKENEFCRKCEIAFIKEAKLGDVCQVYHYNIDYDKHAYVGYVNDEICFECILYMEV